MTINTTNITSGPYTGNGATVNFTYDFRVDTKNQLIVYETTDTGVETTLTVDTDYTVNNIGEDSGGTITRVAGALPTDYTWYIRSNYQETQETAFASQGGFFPAVHESAFDKLTFLIQQINDRIGRSVRLGDSYSGNASAEIPAPAALKFLRWNVDADTLENVSGTNSAIAVDVTSDDGNVQDDLNRRGLTFNTVAEMVADTDIKLGQTIGVYDYATGNNSGILFFKAVAAGTGTANGGSYIDSIGVPAVQFKQNFPAIVTFKMYGAAGDGITNDASEVYAAINNSSNKIIDGGGSTYRLDTASTLTSENITIQNAVFDISNIPDQGGSPDWIMTFSGTQGTATNLTANALKGASVLAVTDSTGFSVDAYAWLSSSAVFESTASVSLGHVVKVKSVDSAVQVTLYDDVLYDFNTTDTAQLSPLTTKKNIALSNVRVIGSGANNQSAFYFDKCEDVTVENSDFEFCHYAAAAFSRCINFNVNNNTVRYARSTGLSYGFPVLNGCYGGRIQNGYGEDMRHYVTVGGSNGVNVFTTVAGNHIKSTKDGGIDAHPACDFMTIVGNTVEGASTDSGGHDGIIFQGLNCVITGNTIVGARRYSIMAQHLPDIGTGSCVIADNLIANSGDSASTDAGIQVTAEGTNINLDGVSITGNVIKGTNEYGIYVYGLSGNMENVNISNNTSNGMTSRGIFVNCNPTYTIDRLVISANILEGSGGEGIYLLGETTNNITNAAITGNVVDGFTFGLRTIKVDEMTETGNIFKNYSDPYEISTDSTNIRLDTRNYSAFTVTNATFSLEEHNDWIVCNRAATITLTLRSAATYPGKVINIKTIQAQSVISSASDIVPIGDSVAGTAILPAVDGAWVVLRSDGVNWVVMQQG